PLDAGEAFAPINCISELPDGLGLEPSSFPLSLALFTPKGATPAANADDGYFRAIGSAAPEPNATRAAGFDLRGLAAPTALPGFSGRLYVARDFPLCPVWLPALFDEVAGTQAGLRRVTNPGSVVKPASGCEDFLPADGPGFS